MYPSKKTLFFLSFCTWTIVLFSSCASRSRERKVCEELPPITNGTWKQKVPIRNGETITSKCEDRYMGPPPNATCRDGVWIRLSGSCLPGPSFKACDFLPEVEGAKWNKEAPVNSGVLVKSTCLEGFTGENPPVGVCKDGTFEVTGGSCK